MTELRFPERAPADEVVPLRPWCETDVRAQLENLQQSGSVLGVLLLPGERTTFNTEAHRLLDKLGLVDLYSL